MALLNAAKRRRLHANAGAIGSFFLATSAITGLLWANANRLYWRADDYKKKKAPHAALPLSGARLDARQALRAARRAGLGPDESAFSALTLKTEGGRLVYEAQAGKAVVLIDAVDGRALSPLSQEYAARVAAQYAPPGASRISTLRQERFTGRDNRARGPVWSVEFQGGVRIVVDAQSGAIVEEYDPSRRFHFWIMKIHKLDFFGTDKALTAIPALFLLGLLASGLSLWRRRTP